jgi:general stress protein 26
MEKNKGEIQNLNAHEAIDKFKELVKHNAICLFTTNLSERPLQTRPMSTQKVCDQGNFWFLSDRDSDKNQAINKQSEVQLFFSNTGDSEYLTVFGEASISYDKKKIEDLWTPIAKAWFTEGKDDPRISIIKVVPKDAFYWDTRSGKMISMIKIAASVLAGQTMDNGVEGRLSL